MNKYLKQCYSSSALLPHVTPPPPLPPPPLPPSTLLPDVTQLSKIIRELIWLYTHSPSNIDLLTWQNKSNLVIIGFTANFDLCWFVFWYCLKLLFFVNLSTELNWLRTQTQTSNLTTSYILDFGVWYILRVWYSVFELYAVSLLWLHSIDPPFPLRWDETTKQMETFKTALESVGPEPFFQTLRRALHKEL